MEQSIRNQLPGTIKSIIYDKVLCEVIVETSIGDVASVITTRSMQDMQLRTGDQVFVLVKQPMSLCVGEAKRDSVG